MVIWEIERKIKMSFKKWFNDYIKIAVEFERQNALKQNPSVPKNTHISIHTLNDKIFQSYISYRIERINWWLVFATWGLAIGTLILSGLTIYLQYFK